MRWRRETRVKNRTLKNRRVRHPADKRGPRLILETGGVDGEEAGFGHFLDGVTQALAA